MITKKILKDLGVDEKNIDKIYELSQQHITELETKHEQELESETTKTRRSTQQAMSKKTKSLQEYTDLEAKYNDLVTKNKNNTLTKLLQKKGVIDGFEEDVIKNLDLKDLDFDNEESLNKAIDDLLKEKPKYLKENPKEDQKKYDYPPTPPKEETGEGEKEPTEEDVDKMVDQILDGLGE